MRLTVMLLIAATLKVSAGATAQTVSLSARNVSMENVFSAVKKQTGYLFFYDRAMLRDTKPVNIQAQQQSLPDFLSEVFKGQPLDYTIKDKTIFIKRRDLPAAPAPQQQPVTGTVKDASGVPLIGVTVKVKGTHNGAITNTEGKFSIKAQPGDVLYITYVGFEPKEITVGNTTDFPVVLQAAVNALNETVVVAYGTTSKRFNTGSVTSIKANDIASNPVMDPLAALQARVPGLQINSTNGLPGAAFNVLIRGQNSVLQANQPLFIIDGVPFISDPLNEFTSANGKQSPLASINPADIERIDVLKDADATSIYGSRGANGVVLITTKRGKAGKTKTDFNVYTGAGKVVNMVDMLSTPQYLQMRREAFKNDNKTPDEETAPDLLLWDQQKTTDWQKLMIGNTAHLTEAQGSVSGGSTQTQFRLSGTYRKETTVMPNKLGITKGAGSLSADHSNKDGRFHIGAVVNYSSLRDNSIAASLASFTDQAPNYPIYDSLGGYYWTLNGLNPMAYLLRSSNARTNNLVAQSDIRYTPVPGLNLKANVGYTQTNMQQTLLLPGKSFNPNQGIGSSAQYGNTDVSTYIVEPQIDYTTTIAKGTLQLLAGGSWQQALRQGSWVIGEGYSSDAMLEDMSSAAKLTPKQTSYALYRYNAVFGRINYNWDEKYLVNATFRRDGSTRFGPGNRFGNFGAVGAAWIFSKESFIPEGSILSFGKLRASIGSSGNDNILDYAYLDAWSTTSLPYDGITGLTPARLANPEYHWETSHKKEVGLDLGFFKDRLLITADYYHNMSDNQLLDYKLSPQVGFPSVLRNFPAKVLNSGWEFEINSINIQRKAFTWRSSFNLTINKNELKEFPNIESSTYKDLLVVGKSLTIQKGFQFTGIDPQTGLALFRKADGSTNSTVYDPDDNIILGDKTPKFYGGLQNTFSYKGISLEFFFQFVKQEGGSFNYGYGLAPIGSGANQNLDALGRWTTPGQGASAPKATLGSGAANARSFALSSAQWGDASFIRLKNLSLRYDLSKYVQQWKLGGASIYGTAQNLFTITGYEGYDPETQGRSMPPLKSYTIGLQLSL
ncbi:TonB-dependent receptor [Chitinophaga qingshengii]|uniref:TonB-dependent receptor n=1 Tax=Chitinophaga qingshengii TaxID=1569794 RepID=A0ABR7TJ13_9BACT|nr:TonB-dependent receptor [Chitinophaga qingshengii]MBC9929472.1 TonB-dependent receptor [Chitinophaga qingshengii]